MISARVKSRLGAAAAALTFLFLFGGVGVFGTWVVVGSIHDGVRAKDWVKVKADVRHVDEGTVTYSYDWQGAKYTSDRVGVFLLGGNTDLDDFNERIDALLAPARDGKPITAFVNPETPAQAMLDREIPWKLIMCFVPFALGFGGAGLAAFYLIGRDAIDWKPRKSTRGSRAGVPLLKPRARQALFEWAVALVWNAVALPIALVAIPGLWAEGEYVPILILLLFPLVGLLILGNALASTGAAMREGNPFNARSAT